ncbi:transcriptional regulator, AraC family (plasmid) [Azoarcus sp. KH32C]|nr:transcriptional regulator, AraC family [Azoarcus sp. KH32C]
MTMPTSTTIPIDFVRELLTAVPDPARHAAYLASAGIAPALMDESSARVTTNQFSDLYRLLARELDDELPGMFSRPVRGGALKLLCLSMLEAPNLRVALYRLSCFFRLLIDDMRIQITVSHDVVCVALVPAQGAEPARVLAQEMMLKVVHGVTSWLAGKQLPLERADFCYPPPQHASAYAYLFPGPVFFDQARTALYFRIGNLDVPTRRNKRTLTEFLRRAPADWLFVSSAERVISHRVREYLENHLEGATPIDEVADVLHCSIRTLSRRLSVEGTSYQAIKDELRRDVAIQLLTKTATPVAVIGARIGFDDPTTFYRAFKKWTGSTPGAYRPT